MNNGMMRWLGIIPDAYGEAMAFTRDLFSTLTDKPDPTALKLDGMTALSALVAGSVACGVPLAQGVFTGWSLPRLGAYIVLAVLYLGLVQQSSVLRATPTWLQRHIGWYIVSAGCIGYGLQTLSGDPFIQPIVFTIPIVQATMTYAPLTVAGIGITYLCALMLGLWQSGAQQLGVLLVSVAAYGALMVFMVAFTRLAVAHSLAHAHAVQLADELARERDDLVRLATSTATLTRDLELPRVVEQIAHTAQQLVGATQGLLWLRDDDASDAPLVLATAVPPSVTRAPSTLARQVCQKRAARTAPNALAVPLTTREVVIGVLELHAPPNASFGEAELRLLQPFVAAAVIAIANARLFAQAQQAATLAERNRLARELHDTIAQGLTAVAMQLEAAQRSFTRDAPRTQARLQRAHELARQTLDDVRGSVWTLAEPLLDGTMLGQTLDELMQQFAARTGIAASYTHRGPLPTLSATAATQTARIVREALQNIEKHAHATQVTLTSVVDAGMLRVEVCDNGIGFVPDAIQPGRGFGLVSLHERARLAGGTLSITSAPETGTHVSIALAQPHAMPNEE